ncbi:MAG: hypothetical protein B6D46_09910 [Polyangiaceae bacterium UTPRO1]|nr:hypothetical protein [Myxococcales bacterium]OQY66480.1 MAG: hypothetical protein B6D46_09910 [Polyangiaceae bacterium UTPRO1]
MSAATTAAYSPAASAAVPVALAAIAIFLVFGTHARYGGWNDTSRLAMVEAIVEHGRLYVDGTEMGRKSGDVCMIDGHYYSDKPPAVALMAVPVYAAEVARGLTFRSDLPRAYYWTTLLTIGATTWLGLLFLARFLGRIVPDPRWRALTLVAIGLGSLNTVYSVTFSNHPPSATALLTGTLLVWSWRRFGAGLPTLATGGLLVGTAATADHGAAFYLPFLLSYIGWPGAPRRGTAILTFGAVAAAPIAGYLGYAYVLSGSPLPLSLQPRLFEYPGSYFAASAGHLAGSSLPHASLSALLAYVWLCTFGTRGIFALTPVLLFVVIGMLRLTADRTYPWRAELGLVIAPTTALTAYYLATSDNPGGNSYGVRWFCLFIPLLYVFFADAYATLRSRAGRTAFWIAYAVSFPLAMIGARDPWLDPTPWGTGYAWIVVLRAHGWWR